MYIAGLLNEIFIFVYIALTNISGHDFLSILWKCLSCPVFYYWFFNQTLYDEGGIFEWCFTMKKGMRHC